MLRSYTEPLSEISLPNYLGMIYYFDFPTAVQIYQRYRHVYNETETSNLLRAHGIAGSTIDEIHDLHALLEGYENKTLSPIERGILENQPELEASYLVNLPANAYTNPCGYGPLHLAILARHAGLATELIQAGADINTPSTMGSTPLMLYIHRRYATSEQSEQDLAEAMTSRIENVDTRLNDRGVTIADLLFEEDNLQPLLLEKTNDPLFCFFKKESDLLELSHTPSITRIAISTGETLWSSAIWGTSRLLSDNHPNVTFHLVTKDMADKGGEPFLKQFDAVINPGSGDSYPRSLPIFTKKDCAFYFTLEQHYQAMLDSSYQLGIPYLGICAGNQHLGLYHDAAIVPVQGYNRGTFHSIFFQEGTLAHFQCLSKEEQATVLESGHFPPISFQGLTAHRYALTATDIGDDLLVGAVSEEGVVMSCVHKNGIRYGVQFHPEWFYYPEARTIFLYEKHWFDNFMDLADMHRDYRLGLGTDPAIHYQKLQERLQALALSTEEPLPLLDPGYASIESLFPPEHSLQMDTLSEEQSAFPIAPYQDEYADPFLFETT